MQHLVAQNYRLQHMKEYSSTPKSPWVEVKTHMAEYGRNPSEQKLSCLVCSKVLALGYSSATQNLPFTHDMYQLICHCLTTSWTWKTNKASEWFTVEEPRGDPQKKSRCNRKNNRSKNAFDYCGWLWAFFQSLHWSIFVLVVWYLIIIVSLIISLAMQWLISYDE